MPEGIGVKSSILTIRLKYGKKRKWPGHLEYNIPMLFIMSPAVGTKDRTFSETTLIGEDSFR